MSFEDRLNDFIKLNNNLKSFCLNLFVSIRSKIDKLNLINNKINFTLDKSDIHELYTMDRVVLNLKIMLDRDDLFKIIVDISREYCINNKNFTIMYIFKYTNILGDNVYEHIYLEDSKNIEKFVINMFNRILVINQ